MNDSNQNNSDKLLPELNVSGDNQIIWLGLIVAFVITGGSVLWNLVINEDTEEIVEEVEALVDESLAASTTAIAEDPLSATTTPTTVNTAVSNSVLPDSGEQQAAVASLPGDITVTPTDEGVVLTGFVADRVERQAAVAAVDATTDETVINKLLILEPSVITILTSLNTQNAAVDGVGTEMTLIGTVESEEIKAQAREAVRGLNGVTKVNDDNLVVSGEIASPTP